MSTKEDRRHWRTGLVIEAELQLFDGSVKRVLELLHTDGASAEDVRRLLEVETEATEQKRALLWSALARFE